MAWVPLHSHHRVCCLNTLFASQFFFFRVCKTCASNSTGVIPHSRRNQPQSCALIWPSVHKPAPTTNQQTEVIKRGRSCYGAVFFVCFVVKCDDSLVSYSRQLFHYLIVVVVVASRCRRRSRCWLCGVLGLHCFLLLRLIRGGVRWLKFVFKRSLSGWIQNSSGKKRCARYSFPFVTLVIHRTAFGAIVGGLLLFRSLFIIIFLVSRFQSSIIFLGSVCHSWFSFCWWRIFC